MKIDPAALPRAKAMINYILSRAVRAVEDYDRQTIRVTVGDQMFEDPRRDYPSEKLVAKVALAVDALGLGSRNEVIEIDDGYVEELVLYARYRVTPRYYRDRRRSEHGERILFCGELMP